MIEASGAGSARLEVVFDKTANGEGIQKVLDNPIDSILDPSERGAAPLPLPILDGYASPNGLRCADSVRK